MLIFSVSFQFFVCHSEEDILGWKGLRRVDAQTNCVQTAGFKVRRRSAARVSNADHRVGDGLGVTLGSPPNSLIIDISLSSRNLEQRPPY